MGSHLFSDCMKCAAHHERLTSALHSCHRSVCTGPAVSGIPPPGPMTWGACCVHGDGGESGGGGGERLSCAV